MRDVRVSANEVAVSLLREGKAARLVATGHSMSPLIRSGDELEIRPLASRPRLGDVVAVETAGRLLVHRVVSTSRETLATRGDVAEGPDRLEGPVILGRVFAILRGPSPRTRGLGPSRVLLAWASRLGLLRLLARAREAFRRPSKR